MMQTLFTIEMINQLPLGKQCFTLQTIFSNFLFPTLKVSKAVFMYYFESMSHTTITI